MESSPVRMAFASTAYGPLWPPVVNSWFRAMLYAQRQLVRAEIGELAGIGLTDRMYVHSADNQLVRDFLQADPPLTHLFHTESDMLLPDDCLVQLLALKKPIVSGVYFLRNGNGQPCLYRRCSSMPGDSYAMTPVTVFPQDQPFLLKGCPGLGCVLFERQVFETLQFPWFDLKESGYGSDLFFFTNAMKHKVETWIDPRVRCGQIEYKIWTHDDYAQRLREDPAFGRTGYVLSDPSFEATTPSWGRK